MTLFDRICREKGADKAAGIRMLMPDQVLLQDALATPVFLQLEAAGVRKLAARCAVYCDHNTLQTGFRNSDDHRYLEDAAHRYGCIFSPPGNGICHQVHLESLSFPGGIMLGADSHTPTSGAVGMLAVGVGGLTAVAALAGEPYVLPRPKILGIRLDGRLPSGSTAKDLALHLLLRLTVKGGVGKVLEFFGPGVATLSVFERATVCNMGAETGATTSLFPSDERTREFLKAMGREGSYHTLSAPSQTNYDEVLEVDLDTIGPLVALPHSPDKVVDVKEVEGLELDQVCVGSCTNASYPDLAGVALAWKGRSVKHGLDVSVAAGTRRTLGQLTQDGLLHHILASGARLLESTCGPCNGIGLSPGSSARSLRTFNRNFKGRSGTSDAEVFLCGPLTAAASALTGHITDPRSMGEMPAVQVPGNFSFTQPLRVLEARHDHYLRKGPNIREMPRGQALPDSLELRVELLAGDDVTTDHILPGGSDMLSLRSNIPDSARFAFSRIDPGFAARIENLASSWAVVAGENYGQGSSREHAVMAPLYLGMRAVIAKSFARIYRRNCISYGVLPLCFADPSDYERMRQGQSLQLDNLHSALQSGRFRVESPGGHTGFEVTVELTDDERELLLAGGVLAWLRERQAGR